MPLERYRQIIPDWDRFLEAVVRPEPVAIRVRTARISVEEVRARLEARGFVLESVDGIPDFLRVLEGPASVSETVEHWLGLFYRQQLSTGLAAPQLGPEPGERVLDMCAAPGGKTGHMADLMKNRGCVVAAELKEHRLRVLLGNLYRTAHPNVIVVSANSRTFPPGALFDRVLVDAPCSAEGTLRKRHGKTRRRSESFLKHVTGAQEAILRRGIELTRPGGTVLYVTCTFAPEENEAVVDRVLKDTPVTLDPISLPVPHSPGLTEFDGTRFAQELAGACRVYPHHLDSGGLFMARLVKIGGQDDPNGQNDPSGGDPVEEGPHPRTGWASVPSVFPVRKSAREDPAEQAEPHTVHEAVAALLDDFEVDPSTLEGVGWMVRGQNVWLQRCGEWPLEGWPDRKDWKVHAVGLRAFGPDVRRGLRPSNDVLRWLGAAVRHRIVDLSVRDTLRLLHERHMRAEHLDTDMQGVPDGYVVLRLDGDVLGRGGLWEGTLHYEIQKVHARSLRRILEAEAERAGDAS